VKAPVTRTKDRYCIFPDSAEPCGIVNTACQGAGVYALDRGHRSLLTERHVDLIFVLAITMINREAVLAQVGLQGRSGFRVLPCDV